MKILDKLKTSKYVLTLAMVSTMLVGCNSTFAQQKLPDGIYPTTSKSTVDIRMGVKSLVCALDDIVVNVRPDVIVKWDKESNLWVFYNKDTVTFYNVSDTNCLVVANNKAKYYVHTVTNDELFATLALVNKVKHYDFR